MDDELKQIKSVYFKELHQILPPKTNVKLLLESDVVVGIVLSVVVVVVVSIFSVVVVCGVV